jgi:hypothetical protein
MLLQFIVPVQAYNSSSRLAFTILTCPLNVVCVCICACDVHFSGAILAIMLGSWISGAGFAYKSQSRKGDSDFGVNAKRIAFINAALTAKGWGV